jgi:chromate transport protein ChrA
MHVHTWSLTFYRLALHLYPRPFRRAFGAELALDFELASAERWRADGWPGLIDLWWQMIGDLAVSVLVQWSRAKWPLSTWVVGAASASTIAVAWYVYRAAWRIAHDSGDRDLAVLLIAVSAFLVVLVCTLTFTTWIVRPHRPRPR